MKISLPPHIEYSKFYIASVHDLTNQWPEVSIARVPLQHDNDNGSFMDRNVLFCHWAKLGLVMAS